MIEKTVARRGSMHPTRELKVLLETNRDAIICITQDGMVMEGDTFEEQAVIEFCVSGGRSPHTLQALHDLALAMERDKIESPLPRE